MKTLSLEEVQGLLKKSEPPTYADDAEMQFCNHCGYCEDPEHCVYGVQCPECCAPPHEQCLDARGGLTGLHAERHRIANSPWWREYRA